ncbi:hypothetical protein [Pseudomonas plecoglossicida]|uniref:hypothetical protein n=1 Tax=Pseudomonas plecoglossicida TaxID=70775 RepID=UPI003D1EF14F
MNALEPGMIGFYILAPMGITMVTQCYIANKYTEFFESFLPNCKYITDNKKIYRHAGLPGKLIRTGSISLLLAIPRVFVWRGLAEAEEVKNFPPQERRTLLCLLTLHMALLTALVLSHFLLPAT